MKKLYFCLVSIFLVIPFSTLFFHSISYAAAPAYSAFQNYVSSTFGDSYVTTESAYNYFVNDMYNQYSSRYVFMVEEGNHIFMCFAQSRTIGTDTYTMGPVYAGIPSNASGGPGMSSNSSWTVSKSVARYYETFDDFVSAVNSANIDFDNQIFSTAIPVPEMTVTFVGVGLTLPSNTNGVYVDCIVPQEDAFYIQLQAKYSVCDLVQINLNNGVISYDYLDWYDGDNIDIYGLQDNESSVHVTASEFQSSWNTLINGLLENSSFPQFTSNVPFWIQNPSAQKYLDAQSRYKNVLMRQAPLYGSRMELFARYYAIVDNSVYVGRWVHWNSANPSNTEELGSKYQQDQPFPGFQNTSSDNDLPEQENTYTNFGENTSVDNNPYTQVIVNNNVPNYPDYPTVATYNHDNILVQFINTAKQLPNFFGDFGSFLTTSFAFIPSYIWAVIGFGFMCSIVVMIIKVL